jgi:hypothetical protein
MSFGGSNVEEERERVKTTFADESPFTNGRFRETHFEAQFRTPRERLKERRLPSAPSLLLPTTSLNPHDDTTSRRTDQVPSIIQRISMQGLLLAWRCQFHPGVQKAADMTLLSSSFWLRQYHWH